MEKLLTLYRRDKGFYLKSERVPITYKNVVSICSCIIDDFIDRIEDKDQIRIEDKLYKELNQVREIRHMLAIGK